MKKRVANIFLKIGKVVSIILIPVAVIVLVVGIVTLASSLGAIAEMTDKAAADEALVGVIAAFVGVIVSVVMLAVCSILSLIFIKVARNSLNAAKCKKDVIKGAVFALIAGAAFTGFPIVSGIMMLVMNDSDFEDQVTDVEAKPVE